MTAQQLEDELPVVAAKGRLDLAVACVECVFALVAIFKSGAFESLVVRTERSEPGQP